MRCGTRVPTGEAAAAPSAPASPAAPPQPKREPDPPPSTAPVSPEPAAPLAAPAPGRATAPDPKDEKEVWTGRYSAKALGLHFIGLGAWTILCIVLAAALGGPAWLWAVLILAPAALLFGRLGYTKLTIRYRLTTQRLFHTYGLLVQRTDEVELIKIDDVTLEQNILERMFEVGTLEIESTDKSEPKKYIKGISHPQALKELIRTHAIPLRQGLLRVHNI
jgi:membrane protein YdbS with pleckstrin-like domain